MKILLSKTLLIVLTVVFFTSKSTAQTWITNGTDVSLNPIYETTHLGDIGNLPDPYRVLTISNNDSEQGGIYSIIDNSSEAITGLAHMTDGTGVRAASYSGDGLSAESFTGNAVHGKSLQGHAGYFDGKVQFNGTLRGNQGGGAIRIQSNDGYVDVGVKNSYGWAHFYTDQPKYYFNKEIHINSGKIGSHWNQDLQLRAAGSTKITVKRGTGYVGIGTGSPTEKLHVNGNAHIDNNLHVDGDLTVLGTWVDSDLRLKQDVQVFEYGLEEVLAMQPLTYDYNGEGGTHSGRYNVGVFAQDLQEIAPEFVSESKHQVIKTTEEINDEDEIEYRDEIVGEETYLRIYDTGIKYMLVNAIKEQQTIIEDQQTQLDELKEIVSKLTQNADNQQEMILEGAQGYLEQNQPNPFRENTLIKFYVAEDVASAVVNVYDMNGKLIHKERIAQNGAGEIQLKSKNLATGTYSYSLVLDGRIVDTKQMLIGQ